MIEGIPGHNGCIPLIQEKNKPAPKLWKLVGGTKEIGESLEVTARREVREEIGIVIRSVSEDSIIYEKEMNNGFGPYDFLLAEGRYLGGEIKLGDEVERVDFFTPAQIKEMIKNRQIVKNHADALRACL